MAHLQYMPGDPRLVDQLVYELKSKGIFDQFRKDCIADVDTRPAYQNLRQRVENSVSSFLSRQVWKPDLNKNQLREKLRKHILDGNYLEQGVERIVDQVVNPKVASVFIPQVEDLVYNYLGISRKKSVTSTETSNGKISTDDLLPEDLEAVSPGSVKSNEDKAEAMDQDFNEENKMEVDVKDEEKPSVSEIEKPKVDGDSQPSIIELTTDSDENTDNKNNISMPEDIKLENIPPPDNSPPKAEAENIDIEKIELPKEPNTITEVPHPDEIPLPKDDKEQFFKPIVLDANSDDESSSDSSLRRNMSPLTPIRNYNNENSCDAQQAFENDSDSKSNDKKEQKEPSSFRFAIEAKSPENNSLDAKPEKKDPEQTNLAYQFNNQVNINTFNTPLYDDSSNSNNLQIDYESDVNSKMNLEKIPEPDQNSEDKREKKNDDRKSSHKSSHRSRDSYRHSSSKDKRSDSKQSTSRDSSRHDKKPKEDHSKSKSSRDKEREKSKERSDKKDSRDSSKHRSSSHKSSSHRDSKDSKSHRSSSSSQKHSSEKRSSDDKKSSSSHKSERSSEKSSDRSSRDKRDSKSGSHRSDKDKKSSSSKSKHDEKDKKKDKKDTDDHYSLSGRGNHSRRSTDRDSNDGSSSSKGSQNPSGTKPSENKKEIKGSSSKSDNTSTTSGESTSPSDKDHGATTASGTKTNQKPIRVENHLETPITSPPRLPFVPDVTLKKPKFAANLEEAKRMMKMRKFLDEEQKRMNQEAALLLEFQANVRPSLSQVYSSIPGPELEFACIANEVNSIMQNKMNKTENEEDKKLEESKAKVQEKDEKEIKPETSKTEDKNKVTTEIIDELEGTLTNDTEMFEDSDAKLDKSETYNENKPFSQLMEEISEYSKASEKNKKDALDNLVEDENKKRTEFFEVTIITEELSETEEPVNETCLEADTDSIESIEITVTAPLKTENTEIAEPEIAKSDEPEDSKPETTESPKPEKEGLKYFAEHEKFDAELKRHQYSDFLKAYTEKNAVSNKIHIINCDTYEENILKEVSATFGTFEVINYYKNGHLKLPNTEKKVVKNVSLASEISLPVDNTFTSKSPSPVFSPVKSECSFELSSDYDAKLEEMVNKTSRQQVMEIILGNVIDDQNPSIDYCTESSIDNELHLKRKLVENVESAENNNRQVLKKVRKMSDSDQISSTTEECEEVSNNNRVSHPTRSKYLGRAKRVGLSRPRRNNLPNSPSSDKSVENYEQNTQTSAQIQTPNGKLKSVTRNKVQRYDTSDLYKPKLHYLSRRNNIS